MVPASEGASVSAAAAAEHSSGGTKHDAASPSTAASAAKAHAEPQKPCADVDKTHKDPVSAIVATAQLTKPVIPSIPSEAAKEPANSTSVAFEIPLDNLMSKARRPLVDGGDAAPPPSKLSLPKLQLSEKDLQAKLANTEARWKDLDQECDTRRRRRGDMPQLASSRKEADPEALKRRLREKEEAAALNRQREIEKLQAKLARQEQHARRVQERKKALGAGSNEELRLSWGGEKGLAAELGAGTGSGGESPDSSKGSHSVSRSSIAKDDVDSGKGSSSASISFGNGSSSRGGSGRSTNTDTTDVGDEESSAKAAAASPFKKPLGAITAATNAATGAAPIVPSRIAAL
ncbi:hypothetical protein HK105_206847 [Polyrhizophydium stewartii]|uniref:Uncharacterized protein n=1 Tax=Polyrhizophydium stewartii TaxID=2732419 RepID=A0ABR4N2G3_9FUNG